MLSIEIKPDGGVKIEGDATDLLALTLWLRVAVDLGSAVTPGYVKGNPLATIEIVCSTPLAPA